MRRSDWLTFVLSDVRRSFPRRTTGSDPCVLSVAGSVGIFSWFCVIDSSLSGSCPHLHTDAGVLPFKPVVLALDSWTGPTRGNQ